MTDVFRLWGFDGELKGNEERLQARLPMFTRNGSDEVFLARKLDWSRDLPASDVTRMTADEAKEAGERLDLRGGTPSVVPGQYVVVTGRVFRRRLQRLGITWRGTKVQDGFSVRLMKAVTFDICALLIESSARYQFDSAIGNGNVDATAREALAVIQNVGVDNMRSQLVRTLALHFLAGETDQFVRVLRLGAKSLQEDQGRLKQEMHEHLQFVQASPAVENEPLIEELAPVVRKIYYGTVLPNAKITYTRDRDKKHSSLPGLSVSDLEVTRINPKKLKNWIVREEQAES